MARPTSKPQYRTLVKALDELAQAALFSWRNAEPALLGSAQLYRQIENARAVVERANAAMEAKVWKAEEAKRRRAERIAAEFV